MRQVAARSSGVRRLQSSRCSKLARERPASHWRSWFPPPWLREATAGCSLDSASFRAQGMSRSDSSQVIVLSCKPGTFALSTNTYAPKCRFALLMKPYENAL